MANKKKPAAKKAKKALKQAPKKAAPSRLKGPICDPACQQGFECKRVHIPGGGFENTCVPIEP